MIAGFDRERAGHRQHRILPCVLAVVRRAVEVRASSVCHSIIWYITALSTQHLGNVKMMIDPDRKTYWELLETLTWIVTRDDRRVAAL
ncbi:MAG TPA: hypothetical protein VJ349_07170, partial [Stellaceae bacterium]|nr:hypothetical protein [Stellaceae bacterium]